MPRAASVLTSAPWLAINFTPPSARVPFQNVSSRSQMTILTSLSMDVIFGGPSTTSGVKPVCIDLPLYHGEDEVSGPLGGRLTARGRSADRTQQRWHRLSPWVPVEAHKRCPCHNASP